MLPPPPSDLRPFQGVHAPSIPPMPESLAAASDVDRLLPAACTLAGALCEAHAGGHAADPVPLAAVAGALGDAAARAGLTPDELLMRIEDGVHEALDRRAGAPPPAPAHVADAVVLALWGAARDAYHDTRIGLDAAARTAARAAWRATALPAVDLSTPRRG